VLRAFSVVYWAFICLTLPIFYLGALLVFLLTALWDRRRVLLHLYSCFWACFYIYTNPLWKLRVSGRDRIPWRGPAVLVANHASLIDILVLFALYRPYKWVSKSENFKIPFIGWNMSLNGYVSLTRGDKASVTRMMERCRELLKRKAPVLIFPEGTRSETGEIKAFKDGAFRLSLDSGAPVIPIAVSGTAESLPKKGLILRKKINATVEVLEPISPYVHDDVDGLKKAAHAAISKALSARASAQQD
jgi:1-acyl-sn-glycerol-3-phosphate acyltransferase